MYMYMRPTEIQFFRGGGTGALKQKTGKPYRGVRARLGGEYGRKCMHMHSLQYAEWGHLLQAPPATSKRQHLVRETHQAARTPAVHTSNVPRALRNQSTASSCLRRMTARFPRDMQAAPTSGWALPCRLSRISQALRKRDAFHVREGVRKSRPPLSSEHLSTASGLRGADRCIWAHVTSGVKVSTVDSYAGGRTRNYNVTAVCVRQAVCMQLTARDGLRPCQALSHAHPTPVLGSLTDTPPAPATSCPPP